MSFNIKTILWVTMTKGLEPLPQRVIEYVGRCYRTSEKKELFQTTWCYLFFKDIIQKDAIIKTEEYILIFFASHSFCIGVGCLL
jgi:hypothetical protein